MSTDLEVITSLQSQHQEAFQELCAKIEATPEFNWSGLQILGELQFSKSWGLFWGEELVAILMWRERDSEAEIMLLYTVPEKRGLGAMKKLLKTVIDTHSHKRWLLEVHEKNAPALKLYEELGFDQVGRRPGYYRDKSAALLMSLDRQS